MRTIQITSSAWMRGAWTTLMAVSLTAAMPAQGWAQAMGTMPHHRANPAQTETMGDPMPDVLPTMKVPEREAQTRLEVENNNWMDLHLYLVRDGMLMSLGFMNGPGHEEFILPHMSTIPGADVQILVLPIGGVASYLSPVTAINPGDEVDLRVENNLALSSLVVSPPR